MVDKKLKKLCCPFSDLNSDFCCHYALHEKESPENCLDCAINMFTALYDFIEYLKKVR